MRVSIRYGSHTAALLQACLKTRGPVLELGAGIFSTHLLHHLCALQGRKLTTIENDRAWYDWAAPYANGDHQVLFVEDWANAPIDRAWDVALIDHAPELQRALDIERLAARARYIVCHDANRRYHKQYGYDRVIPKFKYMTIYDRADPHTMVLSNFIDLADFWK